MSTLNVQLEPAPSTPLNLRLDVFYAPRIETPPFVAFRASANSELPDVYNIHSYDVDGREAHVYTGHLHQTYVRLARHLRMDVAP